MKIKNVILILSAVFTAAFLSVSCQNFLENSDFISKLDSDIKYAKAKECTLIVSSDKTFGSFLTSGEITCRTGYTVEVQFTVDSENYIFKTLEAVSTTDNSVSRSSCVDFIPGEKNSETGVYKYTVKLLKVSDDIFIRPVCTLIPKITEVYPPYAPQGYDQDSMVKITFNKSMSPESFGNFSCVHFSDAARHDVSSYYDYSEFKFSDDGTVLYMPVVKNKPLVDESLSEYADVFLSLDFSDVCDGEGYKMNERKSYSYRLNKNTDKTAPVITFAEVTTTADESAWYFRSLTDKPFSEWSDDTVYEENGTAIKYYYGDYSRNHVGESVHIKIQGNDNTDSVFGVKVREVLKEDSSGYASAENETVTFYDACKVLENGGTALSADGKVLYESDFDYEFRNNADGLVFLEIMLVDEAGNTDCTDYSVIKQSTTNKCIQFELELDDRETLPEFADGKYRSRLNVPEGKSFLILPEKMYKDYNSVSSRFALYFYDESDEEVKVFNIADVDEFVGLTNEEGFANLTEEFNARNLYLNPYRETKARVVFEEENGLTKEYEFFIPKAINAVKYDEIEPEPGSIIGVRGFSLITSCGVISQGFVNYTFGKLYVTRQTDETSEVSDNWFSEGIDNLNLRKFITEIDRYIYKIYVKNEYDVTLGEIVSKITTAYGKPCFAKKQEMLDLQFELKAPAPGPSSGTTVVEVDVNYPDDGNDYVIICVSTDDLSVFTSEPDEKTVVVDSNANYDVSIYRINSNFDITGCTSSKWLEHGQFDNFPPEFKSFSSNYFDSSCFYMSGIRMTDWAMVDDRLRIVDYHDDFLCSYCKVNLGEHPSSEAVGKNSVASRIVTLEDDPDNSGEKCARIPFADVNQGEYYIYGYAEDEAGNGQYTRLSDRLSYILKDSVPSAERIGNEDIKIQKPEGCDSVLMRRYLLKKENGIWKWKLYDLNADYEYKSETASADYQSIKNHFVKVCARESGEGSGLYHLKPLYFYPDYVNGEVTCNNAAWLKVSNGWQVFCDAPAFCHTLYSKLKITSTSGESEAMEWEARGQETGLVVSADGKGFTYRDSNLKDIPAGCWYTTICHFADGTVLMSDVQQKK